MTISETELGIEVAVLEWLSTYQVLHIEVQREPACIESTAEVLPLEQEEESKRD